jgi:PST family polysaccharide transporter
LDKQLVTGIAWTAATKWSSQLLSWATLIIVARLLTPSDYGLVGIATVYLGLINVFSEFNIGSAVVTLRELQLTEISQLNTLSLMSGLAGFLVSCALAKPLGFFFHSARLPAVVIAMSVGFIVAGFRTVPYSLLQRDFRFRALSIASSISAVIQSLCVLIMAWAGFRYWSLVAGNLIGALSVTAINVYCRPHAFSWPRLTSIRDAMHFSWQLVVARLSWTFYSSSDVLVAGRTLGTAILGAYTFAWNLATLPVEKITTMVGQVTPAFFSAIQTDPAKLRRYLRALTEALSLITFPAAFGLGLVASTFVNVVLGSRWSDTVAPLQILAFFASIRSITVLFTPLLTALRETRAVMWTNLAGAVVMPITFYIGSHWGPAGIALGWVIAYPTIRVSLYIRVLRRIDMRWREYFAAIRPAATGSLCMIPAVLLLNQFLPTNLPQIGRLTAEVICGALAYLTVLFTFHADRVRALRDFLQTVKSRKPRDYSHDSANGLNIK